MRIVWIIIFSVLTMLTGLQFIQVFFGVFKDYQHYLYALAGTGIYLAYLLFTKRKNLGFWQTYTHEKAHKLVGLMFFRKITSFQVTSDKGGKVEYYGDRNIFITLAPYFFPYYTLFLVIINQFVETKSNWIFDIIIAFTLSFFLHAVFVDARPFQTDIKRNGYILSYLFIATFNLFFVGVILLSFRFTLLKTFEIYILDLFKLVKEFFKI